MPSVPGRQGTRHSNSSGQEVFLSVIRPLRQKKIQHAGVKVPAYLTLHSRPYLIRLQSSKVVNDIFLFGLLELPVRLELRVRDHVIRFNRNLKKNILGTFNDCRGVDS